MSLIIKGMEMPKMLDCEPCYVDVRIFGDGQVVMASATPPYYQTFKAIPLPEKHGRLIDADAFKEVCLAATKEAKPDFIRYEDWLKASAITISFCRDIDEQPTIVPAEGGGEDG